MYVCMCICQSMLTYASSHTHVHVWRPEINTDHLLSISLNLIFWDKVSTWTWSLPNWLDHLARNPQRVLLPQNCTSMMPRTPPLLAFSRLLVLEHRALCWVNHLPGSYPRIFKVYGWWKKKLLKKKKNRGQQDGKSMTTKPEIFHP